MNNKLITNTCKNMTEYQLMTQYTKSFYELKRENNPVKIFKKGIKRQFKKQVILKSQNNLFIH